LRLDLRLYESADDAEAHYGLASAGEEPGDDGVEWTLVGADVVRVVSFQHEACAPVLEADARAWHDDAGAQPPP